VSSFRSVLRGETRTVRLTARLVAGPQTYLAGESYAGQYIPYIAHAILSSKRVPTRLKGLMIGNGWIDPTSQYPAYLEFALQSGIVKKGSAAESKVRKAVDDCEAALKRNRAERIHEGACERILGAITDSTIQKCVLLSFIALSLSRTERVQC